jgi:Flp pilus assembly protein TadG
MDTAMRSLLDERRGAPTHPLRRRCGGGKRGQSTVEFALIVLPLFIIIFAIIDYSQIYFYENALQNALRESTRFATAGSVIQMTNGGVPQYDTNSGVASPKAITYQGREASRYGCIRLFFQSNCVIQMATNAIQVTSATALPGAPPVIATNGSGYVTLMEASGVAANDGPGGANDYVQVTATYTLHTITPIFGYLSGFQRGQTKGVDYYPVHVSAIVKNEPALLNFEHTNMYSDEGP